MGTGSCPRRGQNWAPSARSCRFPWFLEVVSACWEQPLLPAWLWFVSREALRRRGAAGGRQPVRVSARTWLSPSGPCTEGSVGTPKGAAGAAAQSLHAVLLLVPPRGAGSARCPTTVWARSEAWCLPCPPPLSTASPSGSTRSEDFGGISQGSATGNLCGSVPRAPSSSCSFHWRALGVVLAARLGPGQRGGDGAGRRQPSPAPGAVRFLATLVLPVPSAPDLCPPLSRRGIGAAGPVCQGAPHDLRLVQPRGR